MGISRGQFANRGPIPYTSLASPVTFGPPINWFQVVSAGSGGLVVKDESGVTRTYAGLSAGDTYYGPFSELTSMTCSKIMVGDGQAPAATPVSALLGSTVAGNGAALIGSNDAGGYFVGTTAEAQLQEIGLNLNSTLGVIRLPPPATWSLLADGAPMAVWANGAATDPGSWSDGAKVGGAARWNNDAAPAAIVTKFDVPPDMDITVDAIVHFQVAKTGATNNAGNTTTITAIAANQVDGALYDADANFGGVSSALTANATAKTLQNLTLTLALANLAAYPASVTLSAKPTAGTLDTDDLVFTKAYVVYKKKPLTS